MSVKTRWGRENGYRDVLRVGLPLVVSMGSATIMQFTDRMFLSRYSVQAIAAALPAGLASFLFVAFFLGVVTYVNVFVAQYTGAARPHRVGAALWQGIWFCGLSAVLLALLWFAAPALFGWAGHSPAVRAQEVLYFRILTLGAGVGLLAACLSCFYSGRGLTRTVMLVNLAGAALNVPLDWALINGLRLGGRTLLPEWGIAGAGVATVVSAAFMAVTFCALIFRRDNQERFRVRTAWRFDAGLFLRLLRFGLPSGVQFFLDIFAITFFVFLVGRLGTVELAVSNIALAIDTLAFLPLIGLFIAIETMVGQAVGAGRPDLARQATTSALHVALAWMVLVALAFVLLPEVLLAWFKPGDMGPDAFAAIKGTGVVLLRFVALYSLVDAVAIVHFGAVRGAGDTLWPMGYMAAVSLGVMVLPVYAAVEWLGWGLYGAWVLLFCYICALGLGAWLRYRGGKWEYMLAIELEPEVEVVPGR
jgi:MATE family multidrug resistance protein